MVKFSIHWSKQNRLTENFAKIETFFVPLLTNSGDGKCLHLKTSGDGKNIPSRPKRKTH